MQVSADEATNDAEDKSEPKFLCARAGTPASVTLSVSPRPGPPARNKVLMGDLIDDTINKSFHGLCEERKLAQGPSAGLSAPSLTIKSLLGAPEPCASPMAMARPAAVQLSRADSNEVQDLSVRKPAAPPASSSGAPLSLKRPLDTRGQPGPPPPAHRQLLVPRGAPDPHRLKPPHDAYYSADMRIPSRSPSQPVFMTDPRAPLAPPPHVLPAPRPASPAPRGMPPKAGLKPAPPPLTSSRAGPAPGPPPAHMPGRPDPKTSPISVRTGAGSITQGTPLANIPHVQPYEGLLRPMAPQPPPPPHQPAQKKGGSITQGTPLQPDQKRAAPPQLKEHPTTGYDSRGVLVVVQDGVRPGGSYDARLPPEHYKSARISPGGHPGYPPYPPGGVSAAYHHHASPHQPHAPRQPAPPPPPDHMSSRHVLMNDYITSQQMMTGRRDSRGGPADKPEPRGTPGLDGQPPPQPSPQQQQQQQPLYFSQAPPAGYPPASSYMRHQAAAAAATRDTPPPPHQHHHAAPPPHQSQQPPPPQRQGVIQRPTASRPPAKPGPSVPAPHDSYHKPTAASQYGQDVNLSTLVDVAVAERELAARYGRLPSSHEPQLRPQHSASYAINKEMVAQAQAQAAMRGGRPEDNKITAMSLIDTIINRSINQENRGQPVSSAGDHPADLRASPYKLARSPAAKDVMLLEQQNDKRASPRAPHLEPPASSHEDIRPARSTPVPAAASRPGPHYAGPSGRPPQSYHPMEPHAARMAMLQMPRASVSAVSPMAYQGRPMAPPGHRPQHLSPGGAGGGGPSASPQLPPGQDYPYRYRKALPPRPPDQPPPPTEAERARYRAEERHIIRVAQGGSPERANHRPPASQGYPPPPQPRLESVTPPGPGDRADGPGDPAKLSAAQQQAQQQALWLQQQQQQQQQPRRSAYMEPTSRASIASPFDYVKYRIAEAMRTPDTAGGESAEQKERPASRGTVRPHSPRATYEPVKRARLTPDTMSGGPPGDGKPPMAEHKAAEQAAERAERMERAEAEAANAEQLKRAMAAGYYPYRPANGGLPPSSAADGDRPGQHVGNSNYQDISDDE